MGDLKKLKFKFRDHLESTEKNKNKLAINTIGIKTGIGTDHNGNQYEEIFFRNTVPQLLNNDEFLLESIFTQKTGKVQRINRQVRNITYN